MAAGLEAAGGIDGKRAGDFGFAVQYMLPAVAGLEKSDVLATEDFKWREGVMDFRDVDLGRLDPGQLEGLLHRNTGRREMNLALALGQRDEIGAVADPGHPDRRLLRRHHDGGRAVRQRAAVVDAERVGDALAGLHPLRVDFELEM